MANINKTTKWVAQATTVVLEATGSVARCFNKEYNSTIQGKSFPMGSYFDVPYPLRGRSRRGQRMVSKSYVTKTTRITMDDPIGMDFGWDDFERAMEMQHGEEQMFERFAMPFGKQLSSDQDAILTDYAYLNVPFIAGALGTDPNSINFYYLMQQRLEELGCPEGTVNLFYTPAMNTAIMSSATAQFNPNDAVSDMWLKGRVGMLAGMKVFKNVRLAKHTTGIVTSAAALVLASAVANGDSTVSLTCTANDTFKRGERVCFAASFAVHPESRTKAGSALGNQAVYIVQQDVTATGVTTVTLTLDRPILGPGDDYQNVSALPASGALMTRWPGTTIPDGTAVTGTVGFASHNTAMALVGARLRQPKSVELAETGQDPKTGMSVSIVGDFSIETRRTDVRMDLWTGRGVLYPANSAICILGV